MSNENVTSKASTVNGYVTYIENLFVSFSFFSSSSSLDFFFFLFGSITHFLSFEKEKREEKEIIMLEVSTWSI